ncbi:MAG: hypothetical protein ACFFDT_07745 [Candidatus Hodarchaeota archaeon]
MVKFDTDPTATKVHLIAFLLFLESFVGSVLLIMESEEYPSMFQIIKAGFVAGMVIITYYLAFLRSD